MKGIVKLGVAAILAAGVFATLSSPAAYAGTSLKKIGNAIQYPVRKTGENISITTHRALGHNSVQHTNQGHRVVITPQGNKRVIHHRFAHRTYGNSNVHHHIHHHYVHHM